MVGTAKSDAIIPTTVLFLRVEVMSVDWAALCADMTRYFVFGMAATVMYAMDRDK